MNITITINTDNDAFQPRPTLEVIRILETLAQDLRDEHGTGFDMQTGELRRLRDANGNTCGLVKVQL